MARTKNLHLLTIGDDRPDLGLTGFSILGRHYSTGVDGVPFS